MKSIDKSVVAVAILAVVSSSALAVPVQTSNHGVYGAGITAGNANSVNGQHWSATGHTVRQQITTAPANLVAPVTMPNSGVIDATFPNKPTSTTLVTKTLPAHIGNVTPSSIGNVINPQVITAPPNYTTPIDPVKPVAPNYIAPTPIKTGQLVPTAKPIATPVKPIQQLTPQIDLNKMATPNKPNQIVIQSPFKPLTTITPTKATPTVVQPKPIKIDTLNGVNGRNGKDGKNAVTTTIIKQVVDTKTINAVKSLNIQTATQAQDLNAAKSAMQVMNSTTNQRFKSLSDEVDNNKKQANAGISGAMAMAGLPQVQTNQKVMFSAGGATYEGESAIAVGGSVNFNDHVVGKVSFSDDTANNMGASIGVGVGF